MRGIFVGGIIREIYANSHSAHLKGDEFIKAFNIDIYFFFFLYYPRPFN